jgi:hypothetical protein
MDLDVLSSRALLELGGGSPSREILSPAQRPLSCQ